ncbi:NYN domain-containing protein [candidate division NPL-UPA2 bacterium]|nr:NYN domain-containing protein [candidate division NPL-UPA2 bacterium]
MEEEMRNEDSNFLFVDGYNVIHSWPSLKKMAARSLETAREQLIKMLSLYQDYTGIRVKVIFDGDEPDKPSPQIVMGLEVIFSSRKQTADSVIERLVYASQEREKIQVATSDYQEKMMVFGLGAQVISAPDLEREISYTLKEARGFIRKN